MADEPGLFDLEPEAPAGFRYRPDLIDEGEERALAAAIGRLPFRAFEFHGFEGKRRVVSFGWRYDFNEVKLSEAPPIPEFLLPVREKAAHFAGFDARTLEHLLVTEYEAGASIGWHKDRGMFGDVIGVSLLAPCTFRFRKKAGARWERRALRLQPRSAYLLRGAARTEWEHSIPAVHELRFSLTFRTFRSGARL